MTNSMQNFPQHMLPMDPQVCPPPLSSSQSVISGLDKSPASTFRPGHSRSNSTGSTKHTKQVSRPHRFPNVDDITASCDILSSLLWPCCPFLPSSRVTGKCWTTCSVWTCAQWPAPPLTSASRESARATWWRGGSIRWKAGTRWALPECCHLQRWQTAGVPERLISIQSLTVIAAVFCFSCLLFDSDTSC